jgi:hypothetical protein
MGFKAEESVPKLEWDFRPYVDAHGVSPEPSGTALWTFNRNWTNITDAARRTAVSRAAARDQADRERSGDEARAELDKWAGLTWDEAVRETDKLMSGIYGEIDQEQLHHRLASLVDELTAGCPTSDQIMQLPGRVRATYLGWFVGEVTNPEA